MRQEADTVEANFFGFVISMLTMCIFSGWIGWAFLLHQNLATVSMEYSCQNVTLGESACGSSGCTTAYTLACTGLHGIQLADTGTYGGSAADAKLYFDNEVVGELQTGYIYNFELVGAPSPGYQILLAILAPLSMGIAFLILYMRINVVHRTQVAVAPLEVQMEGTPQP